jgi:tripartite-type tricarboxylate transporter receptor subunit TctC
LPDVPTIAEAGVRDAEVSAWLGLYVPKGTPGEIVARLNSEMRAALTEPDAKAALEKFGLQVAPSSPGELAEFVRRETAVWHKLIRERQLQLD